MKPSPERLRKGGPFPPPPLAEFWDGVIARVLNPNAGNSIQGASLKEQLDSLRNRSVRKLLLGVMVLVLVVMSLWQLTA